MAVRKQSEASFVVSGTRDQWLEKCQNALKNGGFSKIELNQTLFQITGKYRKMTAVGDIEISLKPNEHGTLIEAKVQANVDNIFALFVSPGAKILDAFKSRLA